MHTYWRYMRKCIIIFRKGEFGLHHSYLFRPDNPVLPFFPLLFSAQFFESCIIWLVIYFSLSLSLSLCVFNCCCPHQWVIDENSLVRQQILTYSLSRWCTRKLLLFILGPFYHFIRSIIICGPDKKKRLAKTGFFLMLSDVYYNGRSTSRWPIHYNEPFFFPGSVCQNRKPVLLMLNKYAKDVIYYPHSDYNTYSKFWSNWLRSDTHFSNSIRPVNTLNS